MRHRLKGKKLNRTSPHRKALIKNLAQALVKHEQIITTVVKAKTLKPFVDKLITLGKNGGLSARRRAISKLGDVNLVSKIFDILSKRYEKRHGGYSRVIKAGYRYGDSSPMAVIELIERDETVKGLDSGPVQGKKVVEEENKELSQATG